MSDRSVSCLWLVETLLQSFQSICGHRYTTAVHRPHAVRSTRGELTEKSQRREAALAARQRLREVRRARVADLVP